MIFFEVGVYVLAFLERFIQRLFVYLSVVICSIDRCQVGARSIWARRRISSLPALLCSIRRGFNSSLSRSSRGSPESESGPFISFSDLQRLVSVLVYH